MRSWYALLSVVFVVLVSGCGNRSNCKKSLEGLSPTTPCMNLVQAEDGGAVGTPQCFEQPQICPGKGGFPFCERPVGQTFRDSLEIQNVGEKDLVITSIIARGNEGCAFVDPELRDPDAGVPLTVKPQETVLFSFRFSPPAVGRYNALLEIKSNAENYPVLKVPLCGLGVAPDAGVNPVDDGGVQQCGMVMCDDVSDHQPTNCGPGWAALAGSGQ